MKAMRRLLDRAQRDESGISLVEVIIAIVIFALVSTGVAYTMVAVVKTSSDAQKRDQAGILASADIDLDRSITDLFDLQPIDKDIVVNGTTYHLHRATQWVSDPSINQNCGAGGGVLKYKRVNVTVGWDGMPSTSSAVRADTLIDPGVRLNDPTLGTILVSVINQNGSGMPGVTVSAGLGSPAAGAVVPTTPDATDAQGCTYILNVAPGNYSISAVLAGYVDTTQASTANNPLVAVVAGKATSVSFQYEKAGAFTIGYPSGALIPSNLDLTLANTFGNFNALTPITSVKLYPWSSGYEPLAGTYLDPATSGGSSCINPEPESWPAGKTISNVTVSAGVSPAPVAAAPGGSAAITMAMGLVKIKNVTTSNYLTAVPTTAPSGSGDPGCINPTVTKYTFGKATGTTATLALPYGSYKIYKSTVLGLLTTSVGASDMTVTGNGGATSSGGNDVAVLDPRVP